VSLFAKGSIFFELSVYSTTNVKNIFVSDKGVVSVPA